MEDYRLTQSGQEVQNILDGAAMQVDLTAETERATDAEQTLQGNIDAEEARAQGAEGTLQDNIDAEETRAKAAEKQNADDIDAIEEKIPSGASSSNKLATEEYVNDSVATATATFRGTYNVVTDLSLLPSATHSQISASLKTEIATADNNDFAFVLIPTSVETPEEIEKIERYKYNGSVWGFEYVLNNSGFTAAQWAAINSGITSNAVGKLDALPNNAELTILLNGKQDTLTFDNVPTQGSSNPVKSGGVYSAIKSEETRAMAAESQVSSAIEAILLLIPSAASALNQLADKAFVNSSIATATATFRGTYNLVTDLSLNVNATHSQIAGALGINISTADNNDYAFVQIPTSLETPTEIRVTERYKFNGTAWAFEYDLNNSGFTSAQWAAINSGITIALVGKLNGLPTNAELTTLLNGKQNTLTFDNVPTQGSDNPVKSSGIYNVVKAITDLIPAEATAQNQLADKADVAEKIVAAIPSWKGQYNALTDLQAVTGAKAGDMGCVKTTDSDGHAVLTFYQYSAQGAWVVYYTLRHYAQNKPATTGTTGDYAYNGMGRIELQKNMVNGVNTLTQDMMPVATGGNTIYIIRYDFTLGEDITIPANCVLEFNGGSLSDGTISGVFSIVNNNISGIFDNISFGSSTKILTPIYLDYFITEDYGSIITAISQIVTCAYLTEREYNLKTTAQISNSFSLIGTGSTASSVFVTDTSLTNMFEITSTRYVNLKNIKINGKIGSTTSRCTNLLVLSNTKYCNIENCHFYNSLFAGIKIIGGWGIVIRGCSLYYHGVFGGTDESLTSAETASDAVAILNQYDSAAIYISGQESGMAGWGGSGCIIESCEIYHSVYGIRNIYMWDLYVNEVIFEYNKCAIISNNRGQNTFFLNVWLEQNVLDWIVNEKQVLACSGRGINIKNIANDCTSVNKTSYNTTIINGTDKAETIIGETSSFNDSLEISEDGVIISKAKNSSNEKIYMSSDNTSVIGKHQSFPFSFCSQMSSSGARSNVPVLKYIGEYGNLTNNEPDENSPSILNLGVETQHSSPSGVLTETGKALKVNFGKLQGALNGGTFTDMGFAYIGKSEIYLATTEATKNLGSTSYPFDNIYLKGRNGNTYQLYVDTDGSLKVSQV